MMFGISSSFDNGFQLVSPLARTDLHLISDSWAGLESTAPINSLGEATHSIFLTRTQESSFRQSSVSIDAGIGEIQSGSRWPANPELVVAINLGILGGNQKARDC